MLGQPSVKTGSDGAMGKIDPSLLGEARNAPADGSVGVLVVSQGPLVDRSGLSSVVAQVPDPNGLTFTSAQSNPGTLVRLASASNVITVMSNRPPEVPRLPDPALAKPQRTRPWPAIRDQGSWVRDQEPSGKPEQSTRNSQLA